jgi:K+-transporting ATPase c subunit
MLTKGGYKAEAGTYWNMMNGERVDLDQAGVLPGDAGTKYIKAPMAVMLAAAPVIGLIFAVFLPFIGIVMSVAQAGRKLAEGVTGAAAGSASFGWRPIEAYLAGRKRKKEAREKKDSKKSGKQ